MADHKTPEEKLNERFGRLRDKWVKEINAAANEKRRVNGEMNTALREKLDGILRDVTKLGIPKESWKLAMKQALHYEHGDAVIDKAAETDVDTHGGFAKVALGLHADMPLFDEEIIKGLQGAVVAMQEAEEAAEKAAKAAAMDGEDLADPGDYPVKVGDFEEDDAPAAVH